MKDIIRMNQLAGIITEDQAKKMIATLNESNNKPIMLGVGDQITPDMLRNPSEWDFPMEIVRFSNDGSDDTVWVKRILKKKGMFGKEKEVEDTFEDLVYNWEKYDLKPHVKMSPQIEIDF